jgi:hypothetical protein
VLAGGERGLDLRAVQQRRRADVDDVDGGVGEQVVEGLGAARDAELVADCVQAGLVGSQSAATRNAGFGT